MNPKKKCKFCGHSLKGIECISCGSLTPTRKNNSLNRNATFTDYSYNRYESSLKSKLYRKWINFSVYLFVNNSVQSKIMNFILVPLLGGRPNIKFSQKESLLDVGCGKGSFLNSLPKKWENQGCDIVDYGLNDKKITIGNFETMSMNKKFTITRSSHSLEHSQNPQKFLRKMIENTTKNGTIIILSPNSLSLSYRLFKKKWFTLGVDSHYCIMNIPAVAQFLEKNGCKVVYKNTYTLLSSPGSFCSFFGKHNSIFILLIASVLFLPLILIEQISGKADSFIIYAKKI